MYGLIALCNLFRISWRSCGSCWAPKAEIQSEDYFYVPKRFYINEDLYPNAFAICVSAKTYTAHNSFFSVYFCLWVFQTWFADFAEPFLVSSCKTPNSPNTKAIATFLDSYPWVLSVSVADLRAKPSRTSRGCGRSHQVRQALSIVLFFGWVMESLSGLGIVVIFQRTFIWIAVASPRIRSTRQSCHFEVWNTPWHSVSASVGLSFWGFVCFQTNYARCARILHMRFYTWSVANKHSHRSFRT